MYAVIKTGGKQYRVSLGDVIQVEKLNAELGSEVTIQDVLLIGGETPVIGSPLVANAKVAFVVTKQAKTRKMIVFKKKRRQSYRKFKTHRQPFTELFVTAIHTPDGKVAKATTEPNVVDVAKMRSERLEERTRAKRRAEGTLKTKGSDSASSGEGSASTTKKAAKKKTAKKAAKKVAKKATKKKTAKKVTKKK